LPRKGFKQAKAQSEGYDPRGLHDDYLCYRSVGIVTGWAARILFPAGARYFSLLYNVSDGLWG
jgi:hypothetical protein